MTTDTIVAIATPPGQGGVGIVRLSGPLSASIATQITRKSTLEPRKTVFTSFYHDDLIIDQGVLIYFKAPHSFTGEDVIELQAHGSPIVLDKLVHLAIQLGAKLAKPGEFSERAFLNNKIDLAQAEAIADLIAAQSESSAHMAMQTLQGFFSREIETINEKIINLRLYVEAAIDFPDEEIDFLNDDRIENNLQAIITQLIQLRSMTNQGIIMREGISVVIAGRPNAGKSTLINQLAGSDIAIVTDIAGTTRDVLRAHILIDDIPVHIIDTAGLHDSFDPVEQEGIKRARQEMAKADCLLLLIDICDELGSEAIQAQLLKQVPDNIPRLCVYNKIDKLQEYDKTKAQAIYISAKSGEGIEKLKTAIKNAAGFQPGEGKFLARRRHLVAMDKALDLLKTGESQLQNHKAGELLAEDLRQAHLSLSEITGEFSSDDLLGKIFSSFCIGK